MKYQVDDWHFRPTESNVLAAELFLDNGQKAILEVLPLAYQRTQNSAGNEMIVWSELPGELTDEGTCTARWISRPPPTANVNGVTTSCHPCLPGRSKSISLPGKPPLLSLSKV